MSRVRDRLKSGGTVAILGEYRSVVAEYAGIVRNPQRKEKPSEKEHLNELVTLNRMYETLYGMQEKIEKKIVVKEAEEAAKTPEMEQVVISSTGSSLEIVVPKPPEMVADPESLKNSPEFGKVLEGMPEPLIVQPKSRKVEMIESAIDQFLKEKDEKK